MNASLLRLVLAGFLTLSGGSVFLQAQTVNTLGRVVPPAQTVADLRRVKPGDQVAFNGSNLQFVTDVRFGTASGGILSRTASQLVVAVPPDATLGPVALYDSFGLVFVSDFNFQVAPRITQFARNIPAPATPADAIRGAAGNSILFAGSNFVDSNDPGFLTHVYFASSTGGLVAGLVELASSTSLQVRVPNGAVSGNLIVANPAGAITTVGRFYLQPVIQTFSPAAARVGESVTVTGSSLLDATGASLGGLPAQILSSTSSNAVLRVPAITASAPITILTPGGAFLTATSLILLPTVDTFTPVGGAPGAVVTLNGTGLSGTTAVKFGPTAAATFTNLSPTSVTAVVPAGAFSGPITLTTANGSYTSATSFVVAPTISDFTPNRAKAGSLITVNGANFTGVTGVEFANGQAAAFNVQATNRLTALVPDGAVTGPIRVTNPGGTAVSSAQFQLIGINPLIFSFTPGFAEVGGSVKLVGENFAGATAVRFNGVLAPSFVVVGGTNVVVTVPEGATSGPLSVVTPTGTATSSTSFLVGNSVNLVLTGQLQPATPLVGSVADLTYQLRNLGPLPAQPVVLSVGLPSGVTVVEATSSAGPVEQLGQGLTISPGLMAPNALVTVSVKVRVGRVGRLNFVAEATSDLPDSAPDDNALTLFVTGTQPKLSVVRNEGGTVTVGWPEAAQGFTLQQASNPAGPWVTASGEVVAASGLLQVTVVPSEAGLFYRLQRVP